MEHNYIIYHERYFSYLCTYKNNVSRLASTGDIKYAEKFLTYEGAESVRQTLNEDWLKNSKVLNIKTLIL